MGNSGILWAMFGLLLVAVVGGGFLLTTQGSLVGTQPATPVQESQQGIANNRGDAATLNVRAYDKEANAGGQVATSVYASCTYAGQSSLAADAKSTSATAATAVSTVVGATCTLRAFDGSYYGDEKVVPVDRATQDVELDVHAHTGVQPIRVEWYFQGTKLPSSSLGNATNITLGSGQSDAFDYIKLTNNRTNTAFDFKGIVYDTLDGTGLSDFTIGKLTSGTVPKRLASTANYAFFLDSPVRLHQWDTYSTGTVVLKAKDSGTNPSEAITVFVLDQSNFKSVVGSTSNKILAGVESDSLGTPADVGAADTNSTIFVV